MILGQLRMGARQAKNAPLTLMILVNEQIFNHLTIQPPIMAYRMRPTTKIESTIFLEGESTFAGSILVCPESSSGAFQPGSEDEYLVRS